MRLFVDHGKSVFPTTAVADEPSRGTEPKQTYWANEAKEWVDVINGITLTDVTRFLRKRLIGKHVHVHIDYVKPKDGDFEERECVTITYGGQDT